MDKRSKFDTVSFPGADQSSEVHVAVKLAAFVNRRDTPWTELDLKIVSPLVERWLTIHGKPPLDPVDLYEFRLAELFDEPRRLPHSHLTLSWFALAYWTYGHQATARDKGGTREPGIFLVSESRRFRRIPCFAWKAETRQSPPCGGTRR
jgi:hypothetical protein